MGGTLYLDEVAALPIERQLHLLRALRSRDDEATAGHPRPGGGVRLLTSTSADLPALIERGQFCEDLYYRLGVIRLMIPPLRHRGPDVELLAESLRARYARDAHKAVTGFTRAALDVLRRHDWPGNIRELEAAVRRAVAPCPGRRITSVLLAPLLDPGGRVRGGATHRTPLPGGIRPLKEALGEPERRIILRALRAFDGDRGETARALDINRTTLYHKMKRYQIENQLARRGDPRATGVSVR